MAPLLTRTACVRAITEVEEAVELEAVEVVAVAVELAEDFLVELPAVTVRRASSATAMTGTVLPRPVLGATRQPSRPIPTAGLTARATAPAT